MPTSFTIDANDYLAALRLHQRLTGEMRIWRWSAAGLVLLYGGLNFVQIIDGHWEFLTYMICPVVIIGGLLALLFLVVAPRRTRQNFLQMKELQGPQTVEATPEGLRQTSAIGQGLRPWSYFVKWKENDQLFLLYINNIQFVILPKRAFAASAALDQIRANLIAQPRPRPRGLWVQRLAFAILILGLLVLILKQSGLAFDTNPFRKNNPEAAMPVVTLPAIH